MADKIIKCKDCGTSFKFTEKDQDFYREKGYKNEPQRCPDCRAASKQNNKGGHGNTQREMFPASCSECGSKTTVPFQPSAGKPVYCSDCYRKIKN